MVLAFSGMSFLFLRVVLTVQASLSKNLVISKGKQPSRTVMGKGVLKIYVLMVKYI